MAGPHGPSYMGWWGEFDAPKQRGIVRYQVSSQAQHLFKGALHAAIFNTFRRVTSQAFFVAVPVATFYYVWTECSEYNRWLYTKAGRETLARINGD